MHASSRELTGSDREQLGQFQNGSRERIDNSRPGWIRQKRRARIAGGAKLDTARDGVNVDVNRKERESLQGQIDTDTHERDTSASEPLSTFALETVPRERLLVIISQG